MEKQVMELSAALCLLVDVIDSGSLSAASRKLNSTRANISHHINNLESAVGQQLIRRTTRRLAPTEIGLRLYEHGCRIRDELAAVSRSVESLGQTLQGRIRLSVPSGYGQLVMSYWLIEFKQSYPDIVLDVVFENRINDLLRDEIDIAVRIISNPPQLLVARELAPVRYIVCASSEYVHTHGVPGTPEQLAKLALITSPGSGKQLRLQARRGDSLHDVILEPSLISENYQFLRDALFAGLGVGILPDYVVQEGLRDGRIIRLLQDYQISIFATRMFMLYMPNRRHPLSVSTFIEFILQKAHQPMST